MTGQKEAVGASLGFVVAGRKWNFGQFLSQACNCRWKVHAQPQECIYLVAEALLPCRGGGLFACLGIVSLLFGEGFASVFEKFCSCSGKGFAPVLKLLFVCL